MFKIDSPSSVASMPTPNTLGTPGWFAHGNGTSVPYTVLTSDWANAVQAELVNVIEEAGLTLDKTDSSQLLTAIQTLERIKVGGTLNMYVSTTGSDSNDGLTSGTPKLHAQNAVDTAFNNYDFQAGSGLQINYAAGTYDQKTIVYAPLPGYGAGSVVFNGNTASPSTVVIAPSTAGACFTAQGAGRAYIQGMTLGNTHGTSSIGGIPGSCINAILDGVVTVTQVIFAATQRSHMECGSGGYIAGRTYTIAGGAQFHMAAGVGSTIDVSLTTVTLTGTPAFSIAFAWAATGYIYLVSDVWSGSATGQRYLASYGGVFATNGAGTSYLPGNIAGDSTTGYYT